MQHTGLRASIRSHTLWYACRKVSTQRLHLNHTFLLPVPAKSCSCKISITLILPMNFTLIWNPHFVVYIRWLHLCEDDLPCNVHSNCGPQRGQGTDNKSTKYARALCPLFCFKRGILLVTFSQQTPNLFVNLESLHSILWVPRERYLRARSHRTRKQICVQTLWCCLQPVWTLPLTIMCCKMCLRLFRGAPRPVWTGPWCASEWYCCAFEEQRSYEKHTTLKKKKTPRECYLWNTGTSR